MIHSGTGGQPPLFSIRDVTKVYRSGEMEVRALRGVCLDLYEGEFVVLLGPSGSGKSTLLNILGGLDRPTDGQAFYRGADLGELDERGRTAYRRHTIGYVFQFYNLIPSLTARENVALAAELVSDPIAPELALGWVDLADRLDHFPAQLSGGEQQRVSVARAIAKRPAVLLCDEPTGALDSGTGVVVLEAIQKVSEKLNTTTVLITHNSVIADLADRVVCFADGLIADIRVNERRRPANSLRW